MQIPSDLVTLAEEILNEKLYLLCSVRAVNYFRKQLQNPKFTPEHCLQKYGWRALFVRYRKSCREIFCKNDVLENFVKLNGKHLCQILSLKKKTPTQVFFCEFCEIFKNIFFIEHLWNLRLNFQFFFLSDEIYAHVKRKLFVVFCF